MSGRDRAIVAMLLFFSLFNVTFDLYLVWNAERLPSMVATDWAAWLWGLYTSADRFWVVAPWSFAQEFLNVYVTTIVNVWLVYAIVTRRPYRHPLQLTLGAWMSYSVVLYFLAGHVSGYAGMRERSVPLLAFFYGVTLPWLLAHAFMTWDSYRAITARFVRGSAPPSAS